MEFVMFTENLGTNRAALADGVANIELIYGGTFSDSPLTPEKRAEIVRALPRPYGVLIFGTTEVYANGAINVFVRDNPVGPAIGFVKVREL